MDLSTTIETSASYWSLLDHRVVLQTNLVLSGRRTVTMLYHERWKAAGTASAQFVIALIVREGNGPA
jgi:hypothetical protein